MEECVGAFWDRWITQTARCDYPAAAVELKDIEKTLGVLFRALGGDPGLRVATAADSVHGARRRWLQRVAGANERVAHAALDRETLRLPPQIAVLRTQDLNRDLYLWLAAPTGGSARPAPSPLFATDRQPMNQTTTGIACAR